MLRPIPCLVGLALLSAAAPCAADETPLFRLFLRDGTAIACLGEFAHVGDRVVCTLPLAAGDAHLVSLPDAKVDWGLTDSYANALRAARYVQTRGEQDFAVLSGQVARVLNEIALTSDNARKVALAVDAKRQLTTWTADHYNYRQADIRQIVQLIDEAISDFRAAAGQQQFDLDLTAGVEPSPPMPLLPPPTAEQSLVSAVHTAEVADDPGERMTLLEAISRTLAGGGAGLLDGARERLSEMVQDRLARERKTEAAYTRLESTAITRATRYAARADVRGVERALAAVQHRDAALGHARPARVSGLLSVIQEKLDAARRLRLARDQWAAKVVGYRSYRRAMTRPLGQFDLMRTSLDNIKSLAGPAAPVLARLAERAIALQRSVQTIVPPTDLAAVHALVVSAAQLAAQAVHGRQDAIASGAMDRAWQASSAAAGALILLGRARQDLDRALLPPELR